MAAVRSEATPQKLDAEPFPLDWNGPVDRSFECFPDENKTRPIVDLEEVVLRYPNRLALLDAAQSLTYDELWSEVIAWTARIDAAVAPGELVGIIGAASIRFPIAMLAALAAGCPFVALDPHNPSDWIARALKSAQPAMLLVDDKGQFTIASSRNEAVSGARRIRRSIAADAPAIALYTSGSTGEPKGIVNSQRNVLQRVAQSINSAHVNADDRFLTLAPPSTIVGVRDVLTALLAGASMLLLDVHTAGVSEIFHAIRRHGVTILFSFPALLRTVVQGSPRVDAKELRLVRIGGDTTYLSDIEALRAWLPECAYIQSIYAATEAPMLQWFVPQSLSKHSASSEGRISIGYPLPENELTVVRDDGSLVRNDDIGELVVRSPYVALGAWSDGECKLEGVQLDPDDSAKRIWKTGDLVRRQGDFFDRIGRTDRQIKIRGVRVELDGVEAAIRRFANVNDAGVIARTDADGAAQLIAYVELKRESAESLSDLRAGMSKTLSPHMVPWRFYSVPKIPRLATSKLDTRALSSLDAQNKLFEAESKSAPPDADSAKPGRSIDLLVAGIWRKLLGVAQVGPEDDFFDLGGDSLRAISLMVELEKGIGREVPLTSINQAPTFDKFCAVLAAQAIDSYSPLVTIKPGHGESTLFFIHGAGGSVMELIPLCRNMIWAGAIVGLQAKGLDGSVPPHRSVEAMAEDYFAAVKSRQPNGPYLLCGFSFGGCVAVEVARRLSDAGETVAFVGLLDSLPPGHHLIRAWTWAAYLWHGIVQYIGTRDRRRSLGRAGSLALARLRLIAINALRASVAYKPKSYAGELTIFETTHRDLGVPSTAKYWSKYAASSSTRALNGRHMEFLAGEGAVETAQLLSSCLLEAMRKRNAC